MTTATQENLTHLASKETKLLNALDEYMSESSNAQKPVAERVWNNVHDAWIEWRNAKERMN